jgi:signal transduction histidine kinase
LAAIAAGAVVLYGVVVLGGVVAGPIRTVIDNLGSALGALVVAGLALLTARAQADRRSRASWLLLGGGLLAWGLTDTYWTWAELVYGEPPTSPSLADVGYLVMVPLVFAGILLRPSLQPRLVGRRLLLIDTLLAMCGLLAVAWVLVLGPFYERLGTDSLTRLVTFAYPAGDVGILCCLVIAVLREADHRPGTWPLLIGLAMMAVGDAVYAMLVLQDTYSTGHPIDVLWFAALAVIGLAAALDRRPALTPASPGSARGLLPASMGASWRFMLPTSLLVLATVLVWTVSLRRGVTPGSVAEGVLAVSWLLLLLRVYLELQGAAESHHRERQLRVGHASSFRREQQRRRQLEAVRDVNAELTRELDLTPLLALITRRAAGLVDASMGVAFLWDASAQVLVPRAWHGVGSWFGALRLRRGEGAAGRAIDLRRGVIANSRPFTQEQLPPLLARAPMTAALAAPIFSAGQPVGVILVADDRTGRTFDEQDLSLLELFADQAAVAIEHARLVDEAASVEALREIARLKTELLSTVSHELRTPLTLIHGYAELLNARAELLTPEDVAMMADEILLGSRTMIRLVDDLLDFSRMDISRVRLDRVRVDLAELLRRHVRTWRGQPGGERLRLEVEPHLEAYADPTRLDQIIRNLISNALSHAAEGPVVVRGALDVPCVRLEVSDQGPGIPEDELPRIWESFFRGERARNSPNRGSGLGLAVVRQLVELHGGRVEAESRPGAGATFRIWLPCAPTGVVEAFHLRPTDGDGVPLAELTDPLAAAAGLDAENPREKTVSRAGRVMVHSELRSEGE